jgi:hypothetical protein
MAILAGLNLPPLTQRQTTMAKATNGKAAPKAARKSAFNREHKIHLLVKDNPKRKGTKEAKRFDKYRKGMSIAQAKELGMDKLNFSRDVALGYIKIG